ncbi:MAG TPA: hypothetical protein VLM40_06425 [Gemmata sp.]|nr:hypothetical protein [Gemmata sp.]
MIALALLLSIAHSSTDRMPGRTDYPITIWMTRTQIERILHEQPAVMLSVHFSPGTFCAYKKSQISIDYSEDGRADSITWPDGHHTTLYIQSKEKY